MVPRKHNSSTQLSDDLVLEKFHSKYQLESSGGWALAHCDEMPILDWAGLPSWPEMFAVGPEGLPCVDRPSLEKRLHSFVVKPFCQIKSLKIYVFIVCLFLTVLGLCCCMQVFWLQCLLLLSSTGSGRMRFSSWSARARGCLSWSLEFRLSSCGTWALLPHVCRNLLDQGSNPCPLHWQADS